MSQNYVIVSNIFLWLYAGYNGRKKLTSMVIPSIFVPEDWSFTFFEGLNRHPDSIFKDRTVAELGCGNGWISLAIADKWLPSKVCFGALMKISFSFRKSKLKRQLFILLLACFPFEE